MNLVALVALVTAASAVARPATGLGRRQDSIPLVKSNSSEVHVGDDPYEPFGGGSPNFPYASGLNSCNRSQYSFQILFNAAEIYRNNTYRFVLGQPRFTPEGPVIEGDKVFVDHTYNTSQITQKDDSGVSFSGYSLLFFDMYPGALANEIPSHPWTLNTGNTTDGFVLPGLYSVTGYVTYGNGTVVNAGYDNITVSSDKNCTSEFTSTDLKKATQTDDATSATLGIGLTASIFGAALAMLLLA
ncbi:hypothetical protein FA10DRAFT_281991 [Acaromyces ingoldii]|uniref:Uncharacterized protein n=1 Tax=Acaromyces ingoldii TaxID=215250 RepID=A0A316YDP7_9BASI|nr:hypothetical protein FA10DRAFT_281991 [Acaromyces ingoldii]PWN87261.1 hypothetical protein FA10DRAFT_281991 [Acaromyces ingoldii]